MPSALERRLEPDFQDLVRQTERDDAAAHREDVGVVVLARQPSGKKIVAEGRANAPHLVGGDLLALAASAEDDATVGAALDDRAPDTGADRRVVHRRFAVSPMIVDDVSEALERVLQMLFEQKSRVIGTDGDAHKARLYYGCRKFRCLTTNVEPGTMNDEP